MKNSHIKKGDDFFSKKEFSKALSEYKKAEQEDPNNIEIYDKLIETHEKCGDEWGEADLAESLTWTLKKQELENPSLKRVHARLEPEWKDITDLIAKLFSSKTDEEEDKYAELIFQRNSKAIYPLIDYILNFKKIRNVLKNSKQDL